MHIKRCFMTKNSFVAEVTFFNIDIWYAIFLKKIDRFSRKFLWICICLVRQNSIKKSILKECIQSYFLHGSISCLGIYMSVSKPSICFWKSVISNKWRNKLFIHNMNLTVHRKSACCLQLLVFLEIWAIAISVLAFRFGIGRPRFFSRVAATMISKRFCEIVYKSVLLNVIKNIKTRILFKFIVYPSCKRFLKKRGGNQK